MTRSVKKILTGESAIDGAGVSLTRVFGHRDTDDFDPFLMLDAFDSTNPDEYIKGFPWHPHRGIETITYLLEGDIEHRDSLGNQGSIRNGEAQWMTAGSGIIHQEMPQASKRMWGAQLWLNLPAHQKMTQPTYGDIRAADIPIVEHDGIRVRILSGKYHEKEGRFTGKHVRATYLDVEVLPNYVCTIPTQLGATVFLSILGGGATFGDGTQRVAAKQVVLFHDGDRLTLTANEQGVRFLFLMAKPLHEPIAWGGPIVMNTKAELNQAFQELQMGTFIKEGSLPGHTPDSTGKTETVLK